MATLLSLDEPSGSATPRATPAWALWNLGFRPFYLLASLFAALTVPLWLAQYLGFLPTYARGLLGHGQEMLFGYTLAVIAGFLFTAGRNWTGQPTPTGGLLAAYALLWLAARIAAFTPWVTATAVLNAAFAAAVAAGLAVPLVRSANRRNYFFVPLLLGFALVAGALPLAAAGDLPWPELLTLHVGLDLVLFIVAVMGGRVIPMFTNNGIPGLQARRNPLLETVALGSLLALIAVDVLPVPPAVVALVAIVAAGAHLFRLGLWQPWRTWRTPLVWVLHAAYLWIPIYLLLRALAVLGLVAEPLATHALTIGVIGGMTMGMMTRTARGHTGRRLIADGYETTCYLLIQSAAVLRVLGPLLVPTAYLPLAIASGLCWSAGFAIYTWRYWPILTRARVDGKPG